MKQQLKWLSFLALAALTAACTNEEEIVPRTLLPADGQIRVIASVNAPATRAGATTGNLNNFGLFVFPAVGATHAYKNVYMKKEKDGEKDIWKGYENANAGASGVSMKWQSASAQVNVRAYAPYNKDNGLELNNEITGSVNTAQNEEKNVIASDFLFSSGEFAPSNSTTNDSIYYDTAQQAIIVNMKHHLSKLRVNISYLKDITDKPAIGTVTLQGTKVNYKVNLSTGGFSDVTEEKDITLSTEETTETGYVGTYEAIVVPQKAQFKVSVKVGEKEYLYQHPDKDDKAFTFKSGELYTLNLTIVESAPVSATISSKEWENGNGDGKNIETD